MARYQQALERKQMILGRLMEIGTDLFVMSAACSYAHSLSKESPDDTSALDLADYFCTLARRRIAGNFTKLTDNDDRQMNKLAKRVMNNEMKKYEKGVVWIGPEG